MDQLTLKEDGKTRFVSPVPAAQVFRATNFSVASGAYVAIPFTVEEVDNDCIHDPATPTRLTCRTPGLYLITGSLVFGAGAPGSTRAAVVLVNAANYVAVDVRNATTYNGGVTYHSISALYNFAAGEYIELSAFQDTGAALQVLSAEAFAPLGEYSPQLSMVWVSGG